MEQPQARSTCLRSVNMEVQRCVFPPKGAEIPNFRTKLLSDFPHWDSAQIGRLRRGHDCVTYALQQKSQFLCRPIMPNLVVASGRSSLGRGFSSFDDQG